MSDDKTIAEAMRVRDREDWETAIDKLEAGLMPRTAEALRRMMKLVFGEKP